MEKDCQAGMKETSANQNQDITSMTATLLDSSSVITSALGASLEPRYDEEILTVSSCEKAEWYYLLLKSKDLQYFNEILSGRKTVISKDEDLVKNYRIVFKTFVYTSVDHRKRIENCLYSEKEYQKRVQFASDTLTALDEEPTLDKESVSGASKENKSGAMGGGYLFVYAPIQKLTKALNMIVPHRFLVMDLATRKAAKIPNEQMKNFIFLYESVPWNLQFMSRPICDYARNRQKVRITGGTLRGAEGYIVRIHRDRNLVFSLGSMTLAVSGIHALPFENI